MTTTTRPSTATAISKPTSEPVTIDTHLAAYGLREFDDARAHRRWMRRKIGPEIADTIDQYAEAFSDHRILKAQERLYEALARPGVFGPASSSRFGAMRASAEEVLPYLPVTSAMLDLGCGPGHLTSWYARQSPSATITGCDREPAFIDSATSDATRLGIENVTFVVADVTKGIPAGPFELIVSTQSVADADAESVVAQYGGDDSPHHDPSGSDDGPRALTLRMIAGALGPQGTYLAIEPLPTPDAMRTFVSEAAAAGLVLSSLGFTPFDIFGQPKAYPVAVFRRRGDLEADASAAAASLPEIDLVVSYRQAVTDHLPHLLRSHACAEEK